MAGQAKDSVPGEFISASISGSVPSLWTADFEWPFGNPPPTRDHLQSQGLNPDTLHLLGLNEAPQPPSGAMADILAAATQYLNRYPDNIDHRLSEALARRSGVSLDRQIWGNGAGELINRAVAVATQAGLNIVSPSPTFWGYERVYALHRAQVRRTGLLPDGGLDVEELLGAIDANTGIVTFATPGNPSGKSLSEAEIIHIARQTPADSLLMVDEVYHEFCAHEGGPDALAILQKERKSPWLVLRSFSKAYRLAGARVGYGFASDPATARKIREHSLNFTVSSLGFAAAYCAFEAVDALKSYLTENARIKSLLTGQLEELGLKTFHSSSNFVSVQMPKPANDVIKQLRANSIICAGWNHEDFPKAIRIGVSDEKGVVAVKDALDKIIGPATLPA